jgi:hypothetical protein
MLYVVCIVVMAFPITSTWISGYYTLSCLSIAATIVFLHAASEYETQLNIPHTCRLDDARIPLRSPLHHCTVYILPCRERDGERRGRCCIGARYSMKIESECKTLDERRDKIEPGSVEWSLAVARDAMRAVVCARLSTITVAGQERYLKDLAWMLHNPGISSPCSTRRGDNQRESSRTGGQEQQQIRDIGRDVVMALLVWETLIYERRLDLCQDIDFGRLRELNQSPNASAQPLGKPGTINPDICTFVEPATGGSLLLDVFMDQASLKGYCAFVSAFVYAVRVLHQLIPADEDALRARLLLDVRDTLPADGLPRKSKALSDDSDGAADREFLSWPDYMGRLWNRCWELDPRTFGALYLWMSGWYADMGDTQNIGDGLFRVRPLEPQEDGPAYKSAWRMQWRHLWHTAVICQVVILLPTILSRFFAVANFMV